MTDAAAFELVDGTGNVFRDLGDPDAEIKQIKAMLAADIISALDESGFTVRKAGEATGFAAADFSRIRNANLGRFTIDRLMRMRTALCRAVGSLAATPTGAPVTEPKRQPSGLGSIPRPIIVHKSYAQGARSLLHLQRDWRLLFPDVFFFEVASTDRSVRQSCLSRLLELHGDGGVHVVPNVGTLLRKEIDGLACAGPPSANLSQGLGLDAFFTQFNDLYEDQGNAVSDTEADFDRDVDGLIERANMFGGRIRGASEGTTDQRKEAFREARQTVAEDSEFISDFFANFVCRSAIAPASATRLAEIARSGKLGPEWTIYRLVQVQLLYALEWLEKRGQLDPVKLTPKERENLQHDVIDIEYVILGVLQGALASRDKRMRAAFRTLRPDGVLLPSGPNS